LADFLDSSPLKLLGQMGEESKKSANQKQESPVAAIFVTDRDGMSNLYRGPSIDAYYQVSDTWPPQTILVSDWLIS
jgi:hypothetical protein